MRYFYAAGLLMLLSGCAATTGAEPQATESIRSVEFVSTSGTVAPQYWRGETLTVSNNLQTQLVTTGEYGNKPLDTKTGQVSQASFDKLVKALDDADYRHVKSGQLNPPPVGGGQRTLTVLTDGGRYAFSGSGAAVFPAGIARVYEMRGQYMP